MKNIENTQTTPSQATVDKKPKPIKKIIIGLSIIAIAAVGIYSYYLYDTVYPNTDNAYVQANIVNISPKVSGYVDTVFVKDNQFVHKGDPLVKINDDDYQLQLRQETNKLDMAKLKVTQAQQQIALAQANVDKAKSANEFAQNLKTRYTELYKQKAGSLQDMQKYTNDANQAQQQLQQAELSFEQAKTDLKIAQANVNNAQVGVDNAKLNISYTTLSAPSDGFVANLNLYSGQLVTAGQPLFGFIDNNHWWIETNFKETQLNRVKIGQPAEISLDMYDHTFKGKVESIGYASGNTFSLLPAQNATGNWVKVTQRFTVRVSIEDEAQFPLRVGASADVTVNTRD